MKRRIMILCLVAMLISTLSMSSYAYYVQTVKATNVITTSGLDFAIHERSVGGSPYPNEPVVIMPGDVVDKVVTVENTGNQPMYLRILLTPSVNDPTLSAMDCIQMDINDRAWTAHDGYYYYNRPLQPGETTVALFTQVTFVGEKVTNAYLGKLFSLDVAVNAVQSKNNGTTPLKAHGWPET